MDKVLFGKSGEWVSGFALGTMYMGSRISDKDSKDIIETYLEQGGNFVDTANNYAHWLDGCVGTESESFLGRWLKESGKRHEIFLATKVGFNSKVNQKGLSAKQIIESCEKSLMLMNTDYIDLYYAHTDDRITPLEESMEAFDILKRQGKIRFLGASNYTNWRFADAVHVCREKGYIEFSCLQNRFTYLRPLPCVLDRFHIEITDDVQDFACDREIPLIAYSPLLQGYYAKGGDEVPPLYRGSHNRKRMEALRKTAEEIGDISLNQLVLLWMRRQKAEMIPLISGSSPAQIVENLKAAEFSLTEEQLNVLNNA